MRALLLTIIAGLSIAVVAGCGPTSEPTAGGSTGETMGAELEPGDDGVGDVGDDSIEDVALVAADDAAPAIPDMELALAGATQARTTANLNLRKTASTSASVLAVIPSGTVVTLLSTTTTNGFYKVQYNGVSGFSYANYLTPVTTGGGGGGGAIDVDGPASPSNAIARAKTAVGFSYWWGGGAWLESGPTASTKGSCSGSCPSCSHSGRYGADCSGLVAKAWQFGTKTLSVNSHPYSTVSFNSDSAGKWNTVSRGSVRPGDALVYNTNGAGHIAIYEKGDGWGSPTVYECRGCAYGCVHNARSFGSNYHGIRRSGF